jgi:hypothetical protein
MNRCALLSKNNLFLSVLQVIDGEILLILGADKRIKLSARRRMYPQMLETTRIACIESDQQMRA